MRVFDRLRGVEIDALPDEILPGRYALTEASGLAQAGLLRAGDLLWDDGTGAVRLGGIRRRFARIAWGGAQLEDAGTAKAELTEDAILEISAQMRAAAPEAKVSPMLPAKLAAQLKIDELERLLQRTLDGGHLQTIADRPRWDLRYEELVLPIERARRLANSALEHLSSHSECWRRRTLNGLEPAKILGRVSEDDFALYENLLYQRLLDRLEARLARRLARIGEVNKHFEGVRNLQNAEDLDYRTRETICSLWGEVYEESGADERRLNEGRAAETELSGMLRRVRGLQRRGLCALLPRNPSAPLTLHRTNILNHDPHYRHLPPLWSKLDEDLHGSDSSPETILSRRREMEQAYQDYVGLTIRRALEPHAEPGGESRFRRFGRSFSLRAEGREWVLSSSGTEKLILAPILCFDKAILNEPPGEGRIVCLPMPEAARAGKGFLSVSPLDFYVAERAAQRIEVWLLKSLVEGYGRELGPLPTRVRQAAEAAVGKFTFVSSHAAWLTAPLDAQEEQALREALEQSASQDLKDEMLGAVEQIGGLARLCGHQARFSPTSEAGFHAKCDDCGARWSLEASKDGRRFRKNPEGSDKFDPDEVFRIFGRHALDFEIATPPEEPARFQKRRAKAWS